MRCNSTAKLQYNSDSAGIDGGGTKDFLFLEAGLGNLIYPVRVRAD
jgi:hypothetical protein